MWAIWWVSAQFDNQIIWILFNRVVKVELILFIVVMSKGYSKPCNSLVFWIKSEKVLMSYVQLWVDPIEYWCFYNIVFTLLVSIIGWLYNYKYIWIVIIYHIELYWDN